MKSDRAIAREIREVAAQGNWTQEELADRYSISRSKVGRILLGQVYAEAGGPLREARRGRFKLSDAEVAEIRKLHAEGGVTQAALAIQFGVSSPHINLLLHRRRRP